MIEAPLRANTTAYSGTLSDDNDVLEDVVVLESDMVESDGSSCGSGRQESGDFAGRRLLQKEEDEQQMNYWLRLLVKMEPVVSYLLWFVVVVCGLSRFLLHRAHKKTFSLVEFSVDDEKSL